MAEPSLGTGLLQGAGFYDLYSSLGDQRKDLRGDISALTSDVTEATKFKPWTVTSGTGSVKGGPKGLTYSLDPVQEALAGQLTGAAGSLFEQGAMDPRAREQEVYQRMQDAMAPQRERQKADLNQSLWGTGRGGMKTSLFGGSPEQLAYEKAVQEQDTAMLIDAMNFNQQEQDSLFTRGNTALEGSFKPGEDLRAFSKQGIDQKQLQGNLQAQMGGLMAQLGLGGLSTDANLLNIQQQALSDLWSTAAQTGGGWVDEGLGSLGGLWDLVRGGSGSSGGQGQPTMQDILDAVANYGTP